MLRITQKTSGSDTAKYFFGYYSEHELDKPVWLGKGSEKLGLVGRIEEKDFEAIGNNKHHLTGEQITERMVENRTSSYDFTFSVPKSVSIIYGVTEDKEILTSFDRAVRETMVEIENNSEVRVRKDGQLENRQAGNLAYGIFTHGETRPVDGKSDPHLHKHVIVQNVVYDELEEKWKAGQFRNIKANAPYFETVFRSRFADELVKSGYDIERKKNDFEIAGFDRELIDKYSRRTLNIEERARELGIAYAEDKAALGAKTRSGKDHNLDREEQKKEWVNRLTKSEADLVWGAKNSANSDQKQLNPEQALDYAISHGLARKSVISEKELLMTGLRRSYGSVTPDELQAKISKRKDLLSRKDKKSETFFTTKEALAEEKQLIKSALNGQGKFNPLNKNYNIQNEQLTKEQADAVKHVLGSKDFITAISGKAGVGKTYSVKEIANAIEAKGISFTAVAPSSQTSRTVQREEGFEGATTIADLLQNSENHDRINGGLLWVDEASLVGNSTMNKVVTLAKEQNARLLLTGDTRQHNSPERGDAYRILQKYGGVQPARINKMQRQKRDEYRRAVSLISDGEIEKGFNKLDKMGVIKESEGIENLYKNAAIDFVDSVKKRDQVMVVSTTHAQGRIFTETVREQLKSANLISGKEHEFAIQKNLNYTDAEKTDHANYTKGQIVQFHQHIKGGIKRGQKYIVSGNDKKNGVQIKPVGDSEDTKPIDLPTGHANRFSVYDRHNINLAKGDLIRITKNGFSSDGKRMNNGNGFKVKGFDKEGNIIATSGKRDVTIDKNYGNMDLGYYRTSHSSQGSTVNKVIILQSSMSGRAASREQLYVSASRGRFSISVHTDDKEQLLNSIKRSSSRMAAMELTNELPQKGHRKDRDFKKSVQAGMDKIKKLQLKNKLSTLNKQVNYGKSGPTK